MVGGAGSGFAATWSSVTYLDARDLTGRLNSAELSLRQIERSFAGALEVSAERMSDGKAFAAADDHFQYVIGVSTLAVDNGKDISVIGAEVELTPEIAAVRLRHVRRPTSAATSAMLPGAGPDDAVLHDARTSLADLGLTATAGVRQQLAYSFPLVSRRTGYTDLFELTFYSATGSHRGAGITYTAVPGGTLSAQERGLYDAAGALPDGFALAWKLGNLVYAIAASASDTRDRIDRATATSSGRTVSVNGIFNRAGQTSGFGGSLSLAAPQTFDVTDEAITLTDPGPFAVPIAYQNPQGRLKHANVSSVIVRDASTNALLVAGADYRVNAQSGVLSRGGAGSARAVKVSYHASLRRYDVICIHAETKVLVAVEGTQRATDAAEFLPVAGAAMIPLFNAKVVDGFDAELVPVWYLDGSVHRDLGTSRAADFRRQRAALDPVTAMARRGETIRVALVSDSISTLEAGTPANTPQNQANGPARDLASYFTTGGYSEADVIADLPRYDHGDGAGAAHVHASMSYGVIRGLEALGATVEYYNFGRGGTGSAATGDPTLRAAVWAVQPHLIIAAYGTNETGQAGIEGNLTAFFTAGAANGVQAALAIGMPRPSPIKGTPMDAVRLTWRATRRAAEGFRIGGIVRGAYLAIERLVDDPYYGATGITLSDGFVDEFHHPSLRRLTLYAAEGYELVAGSGY